MSQKKNSVSRGNSSGRFLHGPLLNILLSFYKTSKVLFVNFYYKILRSIRIIVQSEWYDILIYSKFLSISNILVATTLTKHKVCFFQF